MYQIVASKAEYTEAEVREALSATHPNYEIESMKNDNGWLVRLKEKTAEFPFKDDEKADDSADVAEKATDKAEEATDEAEEKADDAEEKADDKDDDSDIDIEDGIDEGEAKDLVGQLNDLQAQLTQLVTDLGGKAQEVAEDAQAKDDKIKEIADSVSEVAPPMDAAAELGGMPGLDGPGAGPAGLPGGPGVGKGAPMGPGAPKGGPVARPKRPRPGTPGGGINAFTKNRVEVVRHPGVDADGSKLTIVAAAQQLEASEQFAEYEVVSMTENRDGSFAAKLRLKA